jgi:putative FmdB family regulatory protein
MPIYEWACSNCRFITEVERHVALRRDPPLHVCPVCEAKDSWERIISPTHFCLKGGNWANNGYGTRTSKKAGKG